MSVLLQKLLYDRDVVILLYQKWSLCSCGEKFEEFTDAENHLVLKHQRRNFNNTPMSPETLQTNEGKQDDKVSQSMCDAKYDIVNCVSTLKYFRKLID